jgi:TRAP-type C4-dicarboxylate transport system permease small subunit
VIGVTHMYMVWASTLGNSAHVRECSHMRPSISVWDSFPRAKMLLKVLLTFCFYALVTSLCKCVIR